MRTVNRANNDRKPWRRLNGGKIDRRTAKGAFTRALKALDHVIGNERPVNEVQYLLDKGKGAFELEQKHEEFTNLIEDDDEWEVEERWLGECQDSFMNIETKAKQCIDKLKEISSEDEDEVSETASVFSRNSRKNPPSGNPQQFDGIPNMQSMTQGETSEGSVDKNEADNFQVSKGLAIKEDDENPIKEQQFCGFKVEKPKMPSFSGNVREYAIFRSDFKHGIKARYTKTDAITLLRTCLKDKTFSFDQRN